MTFRKISLMFLGAALVLGLGVGGAKAEFPEKPITLILPLGAGGSHDRNARVFTSVIPSYLGNAMIVKLMPGASGQVGTSAAAKAGVGPVRLLIPRDAAIPGWLSDMLSKSGLEVSIARSDAAFLDLMVACDTVVIGLPAATGVVAVVVTSGEFAEAVRRRLEALWSRASKA